MLSIKYKYLYLNFTSEDEKNKIVSNDLGKYTLQSYIANVSYTVDHILLKGKSYKFIIFKNP